VRVLGLSLRVIARFLQPGLKFSVSRGVRVRF